MKEINDIISSYHRAEAEGMKTALATVVKVTGSSYRQPGARMLVTEDGQLTGAISGGCLEGDALKKALLAIQQQQNKLVIYDTSNDEDADFGVQLGCNGIVHILFEPIDAAFEHNPVKMLEKIVDKREDAVLVCLFSLVRGSTQPGTVLLYRKDGHTASRDGLDFLLGDIRRTLKNKATLIKNITYEREDREALIEYMAPAVSLIIAGAGNDVKPLTEIASVLGWEVTVGEGRPAHATARRFPSAKMVKVTAAKDFLNDMVIDDHTFFVLMTHNYRYDLTVLKDLLIHSNIRYIGVLGPKTKLNRMIEDLAAEGFAVMPQHLERIYGPVGLDIGAETSEEIALSVVSEIKAVLEGRNGSSLRYKTDKIHHAVHGHGDK